MGGMRYMSTAVANSKNKLSKALSCAWLLSPIIIYVEISNQFATSTH